MQDAPFSSKTLSVRNVWRNGLFVGVLLSSLGWGKGESARTQCREQFSRYDVLVLRYLIENPGPFRKIVARILYRSSVNPKLSREQLPILEDLLENPLNYFEYFELDGRALRSSGAERVVYLERARIFRSRIESILELGKQPPPLTMTRENWFQSLGLLFLADFRNGRFDTRNYLELTQEQARYLIEEDYKIRLKENEAQEVEEVSSNSETTAWTPETSAWNETFGSGLMDAESSQAFHRLPWNLEKLSITRIYLQNLWKQPKKSLQSLDALSEAVRIFAEALRFLQGHWGETAHDLVAEKGKYVYFFHGLSQLTREIKEHETLGDQSTNYQNIHLALDKLREPIGRTIRSNGEASLVLSRIVSQLNQALDDVGLRPL